MPKLKEHLKDEFDKMVAREKQRLERKRKLESGKRKAESSNVSSGGSQDNESKEERTSPERKKARTTPAPPNRHNPHTP